MSNQNPGIITIVGHSSPKIREMVKRNIRAKEDVTMTKDVEQELLELIRAKMKEQPGLTYDQAMLVVSKQNRELSERYLASGRQKSA